MPHKNLTARELHWLKQMSTGGIGATLMRPHDVAASLRAKGLAQNKLGGIGISKAGTEHVRSLRKNKW